MKLKNQHGLLKESQERLKRAKEIIDLKSQNTDLRKEVERWKGMVGEQKSTIEKWKKTKDAAVAEKRDSCLEQEKIRRALEREKRENQKITSFYQKKLLRECKRNFYEGLGFGIVATLAFMVGKHLF